MKNHFHKHCWYGLCSPLVLCMALVGCLPEDIGLPLITTQTFIVNGVSFDMIEVKGGTFTMGATSEQGDDAFSDEKPTHQVTLSNYMIGETEVTNELWQAVMGSNPSSNITDLQRPVENVTWNYCQTFIDRLNELTGENFRLPTEAEWEYASRGGNANQDYRYSGSDRIDDVAWYSLNSSDVTHPVKTKLPNELGIYDMSGNVWEWCSDWYGAYSSSAQTNPQGPSSGSLRVLRGGSWVNDAEFCRVTSRNANSPSYKYGLYGFRLVNDIGDGDSSNLGDGDSADFEDDGSSGSEIDSRIVDLGLSVKWANCNIGASSMEEYGEYFSWGETESKSYYMESHYAYYENSYEHIGYDISGANYDVAHVKWGGNWRMPTIEEVEELIDRCSWTWTDINGVKGQLIVGPNGNSIFLPAAGYKRGTYTYDVNSYGNYWTSTLDANEMHYACELLFRDNGGGTASIPRWSGRVVRPVIK